MHFLKYCDNILIKQKVLAERRLYDFQVISDKYEVVRRIAQTAHSEVYLVRHIQLSVYRIAKVVSKSHRDCERILREADIIKNIKHTGIPLVYDIEEDSDSICIIEEYIAGNSLAEYIAKGRLSVTQMVVISIKICEVLEYLHNSKDIIHMDLKPENIIIRENASDRQGGESSGASLESSLDMDSGTSLSITCELCSYDISIIDFDSSVSIGKPALQYGSVGFAAPEQYKAAVYGMNQTAVIPADEFAGGISTRTDCYSVGMLLLYMACGGHMQSMAENADDVCTLYSGTIGPVIRKCIRHNQSQRFNSIEELKKELIKVLNQENNKNVNTNNAYDIYVYGIKRGVGATHVSLCLAAFFKKFFVGKKVLYIRHGDMQQDREDIFLEAVKGQLTETGAYKSHGIYIMPNYGDCIRCDLSGFDVIVHDCGVYGREIVKCETNSCEAADCGVTDCGTARCETGGCEAADCGANNYGMAGCGTETAEKSVQRAVKTGHIIYVGDCGYRRSDIAFMKNIRNIGEETSVFINHISGKAFYNFIRDNHSAGKAGIIKKEKKSPVRYYRMPCMYEWYESNKLFEEAVIEALRLEKKKY